MLGCLTVLTAFVSCIKVHLLLGLAVCWSRFSAVTDIVSSTIIGFILSYS